MSDDNILEFKSRKDTGDSELKEAIQEAEKLILITEDENLEMKVYTMGIEEVLDAIDLLNLGIASMLSVRGEYE